MLAIVIFRPTVYLSVTAYRYISTILVCFTFVCIYTPFSVTGQEQHNPQSQSQQPYQLYQQQQQQQASIQGNSHTKRRRHRGEHRAMGGAQHLAHSLSQDCSTKFLKYQSSPYELEWVNDIKTRQNNVCNYLLRDVNEQTLWYQVTHESHDHHFTNMSRDNLFRVFSMFIYERSCASNINTPGGGGSVGESMVFVEPIEPLVGFMRDHRDLCPGMTKQWAPEMPRPKTGVMDRRFIMLPSQSNSPRLFQHHGVGRKGNVFTFSYQPTLLIFDIGCGSFRAQLAPNSTAASAHKSPHALIGESQAWFMRQYLPKGFRLGRIVLWEETPYDNAKFFSYVPSEHLPKYQFFNTPVSADPNAPMYPWRFLQEIAESYDYVVVKIDIHNYPIEKALLQAFASNPELVRLVDEMFFEFHVSAHITPGGQNSVHSKALLAETRTKATLADAYDLYLQLRKAGLRMHGWP